MISFHPYEVLKSMMSAANAKAIYTYLIVDTHPAFSYLNAIERNT